MSTPTSSSNQLAGIAHILGIITGFLAPLIIWATNQKKDAHVEAHSKEALNFQITVFGAHVANSILSVVLFFIWPAIAWAVSISIWGICIYWAILGFQAANAGEKYRYPFAFRLVR